MISISKFLAFLTIAVGGFNTLLFIGTVIALLKSWIGGFAYVAWVFLLPLFSPAFLFFPWFDAWVENNNNPNDVILFSWGAFLACMALNFAFLKIYPDHLS